MNSNHRIADILDGTSNTLLFGERYHRDVDYDLNAGTFTKMWLGILVPVGRRAGDGRRDARDDGPDQLPASAGNRGDNAAYEERRITAMGSGHSGGCNVALADGSTRFVSENVDDATFRALSTRAGGETIGRY
jgi:prepilin-type processing-associated H-X9-DG protein